MKPAPPVTRIFIRLLSWHSAVGRLVKLRADCESARWPREREQRRLATAAQDAILPHICYYLTQIVTPGRLELRVRLAR